jgi:predicted protein tyrosine phosphatase
MIYICPLNTVEEAIAEHSPSHLMSLLDPASMIDTPGGIDAENHLKVSVNDIAHSAPDMIAPNDGHIAALIDFAQTWPREGPLLIHCWAGISRSTAAALITYCARNPNADEADAAVRMRAHAPHAKPNRLMIEIADRLLERDGRLMASVELMGPGELAWEGVLFGIPAAADAR